MIVRRLSSLLVARWQSLLLVLLCSLLTIVLGLATPWLIRHAIDELLRAGSSTLLYAMTLAIVVLALLQGLADWARLHFMARLGGKVILDLRVRTFEHLTRLPFSFFDRAHAGDIVARLSSDMELLSTFYTRAAVMALGNVAYLAAILAVMAWWDMRLCLVYVLMLPLFAHAMTIYTRQVSPFMQESRRQVAQLTTKLRNGLLGLESIQGLGCHARVVADIETHSQGLRHARTRAGSLVGRWRNYPPFLNACGAALVLWVGAGYVNDGSLTLGTLVGFTAFFGLLGRPIRQTGFMAAVVLKALAAGERVFSLLDVQADSDDDTAVPLPAGPGAIRLSGVHFNYHDTAKDDCHDTAEDGCHDTAEANAPPALHDINLELAPGKLVALVGPSGAGKTTLAHLIPRFYRPQRGCISIDGHDLATVTMDSLRRRVGIAFQDSFLFHASLRENVAWGKPTATDDEIVDALEQAQLGDLLRSLPKGLDTAVGERGLHLSGGQRQRVALARVLLYDPQILLLDEPTASLDPKAEAALHAALDAVRRDRLTVVISHRFWTVRHADQIVVLEQGRVVEEGHSNEHGTAHEHLSRANGPYRALLASQGLYPSRGESQ